MTNKRVLYSAGVYDDAEVSAVMSVLTKEKGSLAIGKNVAGMEERVSTLFGKRYGVMCNSGSSALFLAVELLDLPRGSEVITSPLTFSTDLSAIVRAGLVPVFVDVAADTFNMDSSGIEEMISERTRAILVPNLAGGTPDWDDIRAIADRHSLWVIEDSCDALGPTLRGTPTGTRSHISVTSFALSHIITCAGNGGMVMLDSRDLRDRALLLRRWGRRSELMLFGSRTPDQPLGGRSFWEDLDGVDYDNMFIFDELAWNFEPSEIGAAFGLAQLDKLDSNYARRIRTFDMYTRALARHPDAFITPRQLDGLYTAWLSYPFLVHPQADFRRSDLQAYLEERGIDTRTVWTGNAARQPLMKDVPFRQPEAGLPHADRVLTNGMLVSCSHGIDDEGINYVIESIESFLAERKPSQGS
jgi:CDP-6-deoxy-D-xylo-4-hexulose-3-dehydrase